MTRNGFQASKNNRNTVVVLSSKGPIIRAYRLRCCYARAERVWAQVWDVGVQGCQLAERLCNLESSQEAWITLSIRKLPPKTKEIEQPRGQGTASSRQSLTASAAEELLPAPARGAQPKGPSVALERCFGFGF